MSRVRYLAPMPFLQILLIFFAFFRAPERLFVLLAAANAVGLSTFYLIRQLNKPSCPEWFTFLYSNFIFAALLALPLGLWLFLYAGGGSVTAIALPFVATLPFTMSLYELNYIFRRVESV